MKKMNFLALATGICAFTIISCNNEADTAADGDSIVSARDTMVTTDHAMHSDTASVPVLQTATVNLSATYPDTSLTGIARFKTSPNGKVIMDLEITVPAKAGKNVAVHFHEHGDCGDKGNMSHGHWNPTKENHGKWGTAPFHRGDIGNVKLDGKGRGSTTIETDLWTLGGTADKNILGKALIVHGGTDDYKTQPTGNAGSRIGCGVVQ